MKEHQIAERTSRAALVVTAIAVWIGLLIFIFIIPCKSIISTCFIIKGLNCCEISF